MVTCGWYSGGSTCWAAVSVTIDYNRIRATLWYVTLDLLEDVQEKHSYVCVCMVCAVCVCVSACVCECVCVYVCHVFACV